MSPQRAAQAIVRAWVHSYTAVVAAGPRTTRRAELAADTHDHLLDLTERGVGGYRAALEIVHRWIAGIPDDLAWAIHPDPLEETMPHRLRTLALTGWSTAVILAFLNLTTAIAALQHGWREIGQHWWSALAAAGIVIAVAGLLLTLAHNKSAQPSSHKAEK